MTIAQAFAHAPKLDPTGTSWLPFPFWVMGGAMMVAGRTLGVAYAVAALSGVLATALPYLAARSVGVARAPALAGAFFAAAIPWSAWTGVAPVPEMPTAALVAAAAIACAAPRVGVLAAGCAFAAALSRYEAWPICAVVAAAAIVRGRRLGVAALAMAGPLLWMAWNAHAHGDAMHFVARVSAYRKALGAADIPLADKLLGYPLGLLHGAPFAAGVTIAALPALFSKAIRGRWAWPLLGAAATVAFLVYGDVRDGAPTHHPERALLGVFWIATMFAADGIAAMTQWMWARLPQGLVVAAIGATGGGFLGHSIFGWPGFPGRMGDEDRTAQVARGYVLKTEGARHLELTPCAYEHFAVLAAFGAPEAADVAPATHTKVTPLCPRVVVRD